MTDRLTVKPDKHRSAWLARKLRENWPLTIGKLAEDVAAYCEAAVREKIAREICPAGRMEL